MKVCFFHEKDISKKDIHKLVSAWNRELNLYNITLVNPVNAPVYERPGFYNNRIFLYLFNMKLTDPCDRVVYLRGRKFKDLFTEFISILFLLFTGLKFEIHGMVETATHSRGIIKAKYVNLIQLFVTSPKKTLIHEGYHLLGCGHSLTKTKCYDHIRKLKQKMKQTGHEEGFFPILTNDGRYLDSRESVNKTILNLFNER